MAAKPFVFVLQWPSEASQVAIHGIAMESGVEERKRYSNEVSTHVVDIFCNQDLVVKWTASDTEFVIEAYFPEHCCGDGLDDYDHDDAIDRYYDPTPVLVYRLLKEVEEEDDDDDDDENVGVSGNRLVKNLADPDLQQHCTVKCFLMGDLNEKYSNSLTVTRTKSLRQILLSRFLRSMGSVLSRTIAKKDRALS